LSVQLRAPDERVTASAFAAIPSHSISVQRPDPGSRPRFPVLSRVHHNGRQTGILIPVDLVGHLALHPVEKKG
jgi:hypothetical protein